MRVFVLRHGETIGNIEKRHQGTKDFPLTEKGIEYAKETAKALSMQKVAKVYSSDFKRAADTAKVIAERIGVPLELRKELKEISFGILDGLKKEEMKRKYAELVKKREEDKINYRYPEGESYSDVKKRLKPFLEEIAKRHGRETIVLVGHEAVNRTAIGLLLNLSDDKMLEITQPNNCIYLVEPEKNKVYSIINGKKTEGYQKR